MTEQLTLFNLAPTQVIKTVTDPYWDEIVLSTGGRLEETGQVSLFYDDTEEPPEPDDYPTPQEYETDWDEWEKKFPHLVAEAQTMSVREHDTPELQSVSVNLQKTTGDRQAIVREHDTKPTPNFAPEHTHWVEEYWVKRCEKKHRYYRYCWMTGRKINRCHIGSVRSPQAQEKKQAVEIAIADGDTPQEIQKIIKANPQSPTPTT